MAKFKVGDKVRTDIHAADAHEDGRYGIRFEEYWNDAETRTIEKIVCVGHGITLYKISDDPRGFSWPEYALVSAEPRREFIVIHRSGNVMTAEHRVNREVIKSAKATCAPSDTFDFDTGAKLAFDRMMGREETKKKAYIEREFKIGDRVITSHGVGEVVDVDHNETSMPYQILYDEGYKYWSNSGTAKPAPQPAHRFNVGDWVVGEYGFGEISAFNERYPNLYLVYFEGKSGHSGHAGSGVPLKPSHSGHCNWQDESDLSPAPAPEQPKKSRFPLSEEELEKVLYEIREVARQQREREERGDV